MLLLPLVLLALQQATAQQHLQTDLVSAARRAPVDLVNSKPLQNHSVEADRTFVVNSLQWGLQEGWNYVCQHLDTFP